MGNRIEIYFLVLGKVIEEKNWSMCIRFKDNLIDLKGRIVG